jgi:hypothetical protein
MLNFYRIDITKRLVLVKFTGSWTPEDIESYLARLHADQRFSPTYDEIADLTEVENVAISDLQMMNLSAKVPFCSNSKRALVASTRGQNHAAHLHRIIRKGTRVRVFDSVQEAAQWIAQPGDEAPLSGHTPLRPPR